MSGTVLAAVLSLLFTPLCVAQKIVHPNAHAHNDYEHARPLKEALQNGFLSVEVDVHLRDGVLRVAHRQATQRSPLLEQLYLKPLDSLLTINGGSIYEGSTRKFFLMIDIKGNGEKTYQALKILFAKYEKLKCKSVGECPVKIFLSGERPRKSKVEEGDAGIGIDGRPEDLAKGYSPELMPVISDTYKNWSRWNGNTSPKENDLWRIRELAKHVHAEGKKFRLWAIPDQETAWQALLDAGVDLINTDHLQELNIFLTNKGM